MISVFLKQIGGTLYSINTYPESVVSPSGSAGKVKCKGSRFPGPSDFISLPRVHLSSDPTSALLSLCLTAQADSTHLLCPNLLSVAAHFLKLHAYKHPNIFDSQHLKNLSNFQW